MQLGFALSKKEKKGTYIYMPDGVLIGSVPNPLGSYPVFNIVLSPSVLRYADGVLPGQGSPQSPDQIADATSPMSPECEEPSGNGSGARPIQR